MTRFAHHTAAAIMALVLTFAAFDTLITVPPAQATIVAPLLA